MVSLQMMGVDDPAPVVVFKARHAWSLPARVTSWRQFETDAPDFAQRVRQRFEAGKHKTLATTRRDGSPRISGTELQFADGEVTLGMMSGSMKLLDVRRDARVAVHSPTVGSSRGAKARVVAVPRARPPSRRRCRSTIHRGREDG